MRTPRTGRPGGPWRARLSGTIRAIENSCSAGNAASRGAVPGLLLLEQELALLLNEAACLVGDHAQDPGQRDLDADAVLEDLEVAGDDLAEGADPEAHAILGPGLVERSDVRGKLRFHRAEPMLEPPRRLGLAEVVRDLDDERFRGGRVGHGALRCCDDKRAATATVPRPPAQDDFGKLGNA